MNEGSAPWQAHGGWQRRCRRTGPAWAAALLAMLAVAPAGAQSLTDTLATAYASNPTLEAARAQLRATNEQIPQALSNWRPRVTVNTDAGTQVIDSGSGSTQTYPLSADLSVTQPLYRGGRTVADTKRAEATVTAQRASLLSVEQDVLFQSTTAYMDVWRDQSVLELTINNQRVLERQLEASEDRFEVGEITRTDVAQSRSRLARAIAEREQAEGNLTSSRAVYQELIGVAPGVLTETEPVGGLPTAQDDVVSQAIENNPDVVAAKFTEVAARKNVRLQFGQLLPEVSLVGSLSHSQDQISTTDESDQARVLAQLTVPIYQQGFVSSQIREAKQVSSQRRIEISETRRRVEQEAITAWESLQTAQAQIRSFESEVQAASIALEGVREENSVGARTVLDVLDAEQELLDARVNLVRAHRDQVVAGYQVLQAMGRMTAKDLGLPVTLYDPQIDLDQVRDLWFGFGSIPEE